MNPAALRDEIENGPLAGELAPHVTAGRDSAIVAALTRRDRPGHVSARHLSVSLAQFPSFDAVIHWVLRTGELPDGTPLTGAAFPVYVMFRNLDRVDKSCKDAVPLRAAVADLETGLAMAAAADLVADEQNPNRPIPAGFSAYLFAGEVKASRAEELGWAVNESDVGRALLALRQA